ncbi:MAG: FAD-binding oxidoreductase [Xanthobacteraceae bacterium]|nr:MAG: FAD-binding oxidoreductase [Xanthobacteraceae bacterium]
MSGQDTSGNPAGRPDWDRATAVPGLARPRLTFDLDVDVCVVGGGLAGLAVAREAARRDVSVAVLEAGSIGEQASGRNFGLVAPGYPVDVRELIERVGLADARALWTLAQEGVDRVRASAAQMPGLGLTQGWLQASTVDAGDEMIERLQVLGGDFGFEVEGWQVEQVRAVLRSERYFHAVHYPRAFSLHAHNYVLGLAADAAARGVHIFENTPVTAIDVAGIRKRVETPGARLRASHIVLAGNVHLGAASPRLAATLMPVWRAVGVTAPLGDKLAEALTYTGAVSDSADVDRYRIVSGNRLMWSSCQATFAIDPKSAARTIRKRIAAAFPQLGRPALEHVWCGVYGRTVHGMPQIGELRPGLWVASGFGRHGLNTTAIAGELVAAGMLDKDDRWRLFAPFELVWAGGTAGRVVGQAVIGWGRGRLVLAGALARYRERADRRGQEREQRLAAASRGARSDR